MQLDLLKLEEARTDGEKAFKEGRSYWSNPHMDRPFEESWIEQDAWARGFQRLASNTYWKASTGGF